MERSQTRRTTFAEALMSWAAEGGRVEASFAPQRDPDHLDRRRRDHDAAARAVLERR